MKKLLFIIFLCAAIPTIMACSGSRDDSDDIDNVEDVVHGVAYENDLKGTSWEQTKRRNKGKDMEIAPYVLTFTDEKMDLRGFGGYCYRFRLGTKYGGCWYVNGDNQLCMTTYTKDFTPSEMGSNRACYGMHGNCGHIIVMLNSKVLSYSCTDYNEEWSYKRIEGVSGGGGSTSTPEKPEIGLEDYTCYTTSITVKYRIYNQDKAKVTSAKGYYGTSSASKSVSASVSGSLITIRITGLKKGTTYYVKCSATGKGGTTTSETTKLITDY